MDARRQEDHKVANPQPRAAVPHAHGGPRNRKGKPPENEITYSRVLGKQSLCTLRLSSISETTVETSPSDLRGMEAALA